MPFAKNYQSRPMFHGVIQKIKVARFLLRHGVHMKSGSYGEFVWVFYLWCYGYRRARWKLTTSAVWRYHQCRAQPTPVIITTRVITSSLTSPTRLWRHRPTPRSRAPKTSRSPARPDVIAWRQSCRLPVSRVWTWAISCDTASTWYRMTREN